jgi:hypothetical protein
MLSRCLSTAAVLLTCRKETAGGEGQCALQHDIHGTEDRCFHWGRGGGKGKVVPVLHEGVLGNGGIAPFIL